MIFFCAAFKDNKKMGGYKQYCLVMILSLAVFCDSSPARKTITYKSNPGERENVRYISKIEENGKEVEEPRVKLNCQGYVKSGRIVDDGRKKENMRENLQKAPPVKKDIQSVNSSGKCDDKNTAMAEIIRAPNRIAPGGCGSDSKKDVTGRCRQNF